MANIETEVNIEGSFSKIEGIFNKQKEEGAFPSVLILPPNPNLGGTYDNPAVRAMTKAFLRSKFSVLRINFPVDIRTLDTFKSSMNLPKAKKNESAYADYILNASLALNWLQYHNSMSSCFWVAGFSFGAFIGTQLVARRPDIENFISVSTPTSSYDFSFLNLCNTSGLFIHGEKDDVEKIKHNTKVVEDLIYSKNESLMEYFVIPGADHKMLNHLDYLENICYDYINIKLATRIAKPIKKKRRKRKKKSEQLENTPEE